jgi:hypothetical protein
MVVLESLPLRHCFLSNRLKIGDTFRDIELNRRCCQCPTLNPAKLISPNVSGLIRNVVRPIVLVLNGRIRPDTLISAAQVLQRRKHRTPTLCEKCDKDGPPDCVERERVARGGSATKSACTVGETQLAPYVTDCHFHHVSESAFLRARVRYA